MTLTRKLALALCLAFSFITLSSNAQVDSTTGNLINYGTSATDTTSRWNNGVYVNQLCFQAGQPGNCGPNPSIRDGGYINFSYGTADLNQVVNINRALAAGGTGVQLSGFNFGFMAKNGNGWDDARQDYLAAYVKLYNAGGGLAANYDYSAQTNRKYNWTNFNFSETFANPAAASNFSNAQVGFVGRDNNFWAGNYGPEIYNVSFSLKYRVDPCATNPAYSPTCSGFSNVIESNNLFNSNAWGQVMTQAVAINTALQNSGIGATVHGMKYSFDWAVGSDQCTSSFLFWCTGWTDSNINVNVRMTSAGGSTLLNRNYGYSGQYISGHVEDKMLLTSSLNQTSLGTLSMSSSGWGDAQAGNFSAKLIYTADPCVTNPLYSTTCSGYAVAFAKNMLLGSTVASASGAIVSSGGNTMSSPTGQVDQSQGNTQPEQTQQSQQQTQQQGQQTQQSSPSPQQDANQNPSVAQDNPAQPSPTQQGPASTTPQPAGGPPQTATASASSSSGPSGGGSAGPSKLAMSVVKTAQANDKATQNAAVQNAAKTLENASQSSQASSNLAISINQDMSAGGAQAAAAFASQSTQTSIQASTQFNQQQQTTQTSSQTQQTGKAMQQSQQQQETQMLAYQSTGASSIVQQFIYTPPLQQEDTQSSQVAILKPPTPMVIEMQQQSSSGTGLTVSRNLFAYNPLMASNSPGMSAPLPAQQPVYQPRLDSKQYEVESPISPIASFTGSRAGNPLSEIMMEQRFELMQTSITPSGSTVNRNALPNELAGGIDIASIASVPTGFNAYSFVLKDASFYEPKEVYKNQRTVDNERVLRGLTRGSDSLHQQLVDSQYKIGN
jgi:hypothetical protein